MLTKKMKKQKDGGGSSSVEDSIGEELAKLDMKDKRRAAKKAVSPDKGERSKRVKRC